MNKDPPQGFMMKVSSDLATASAVALVHVGDRVGRFKGVGPVPCQRQRRFRVPSRPMGLHYVRHRGFEWTDNFQGTGVSAWAFSGLGFQASHFDIPGG